MRLTYGRPMVTSWGAHGESMEAPWKLYQGTLRAVWKLFAGAMQLTWQNTKSLCGVFGRLVDARWGLYRNHIGGDHVQVLRKPCWNQSSPNGGAEALPYNHRAPLNSHQTCLATLYGCPCLATGPPPCFHGSPAEHQSSFDGAFKALT